MEDDKATLKCIVIGILWLISTAVGFAFEFMPLKTQARLFYYSCTNELCENYECKYFRSPAFYMVVVAIICVAVALILISIAAQCGCYRVTYTTSTARATSILSFVICWLECLAAIIFFLIAIAVQYGGRISKWKGRAISLDDTSGHCYKVKGLFTTAATLSCVGIAVGLQSYILVSQNNIIRANQARRETTNENAQHTPLYNNTVPRENEA